MATYNVSYENAGKRGMPSFEVLDEYKNSNLLAGAEPRLQEPSRVLLGDSLTLAQFSVVAVVVATGKLALATVTGLSGGTQKLAGVLAHAATSGASNSTIYGEVIPTGCFNIGADSPLVFDASFDTEAKKAAITQLPFLIFRNRNIGAATAA